MLRLLICQLVPLIYNQKICQQKEFGAKKYPIRIRPNTRKPYSTQEATKKMAAKKDIKDEAELDLDKEPEDDEDEIMLDAKENLEDYSSCDITATTSVDKNHDTFDELAILADKENEDKVLRFLQGRPEKRKNGLTI